MAMESAQPRLEETRTLVRGVQGGDRGAMEALFRRYYERIRPVVRLHMGPKLRTRMESEDILQSAFLEAFRSIEDFHYRSEGAFMQWLCKVVANTIRDHLRGMDAKKRRGNAPVVGPPAAGGALEALPAPGATPSEDAARREAEERLYRALELMDPDKREILCMSRFQHLSAREIAELCGCTEAAARMRVLRAERGLMEAYARLGEEAS